ncbi:hypothetical protein F5887DRAFT_961552 [Amanita rubescens]|nr:hypothetical protein F5887DRAFT_961552 [Amanita rubescens]
MPPTTINSSALFEMVDSIRKHEYHPYSTPMNETYNFYEADFIYQPGYFDLCFNDVLDECSPIVKALAIDAPLVDAPVLFSSEKKASIATNASQVDASQSVPFSNEPALRHASPVPADASPSTSACASSPEETYSTPGSPLFTPISGPVDLPCVQEWTQPETPPSLPDGREEFTTIIEPVDIAQVPTPLALVTTQSSLSGSFPVFAADIDILSLPGPSASSFGPSEVAPDFPSPGIEDATALSSSFELGPIPSSQLTRKRKRSFIAYDDYQPETFSDAVQVQDPVSVVPLAPSPATETVHPTFPSLSEIDPVVQVDVPPTAAVNRYATSVPPSLLDQIAAAAVAATIRASPGVNVFAAPCNANQVRKPRASKKSSPLATFSMPPQLYTTNAFPDPAAGVPPPMFAVPPTHTSQAHISNGASYPSSSALAPPIFYGPGNTGAKRRRVAGLGFAGEPIARQGAATCQSRGFPTASDVQAQTLWGTSFMNPEPDNFGHCGIVTPQYAAGSSMGFSTQYQASTSNMALPQVSDNWNGNLPIVGQMTGPHFWELGPSSLPLQQDIVNRDFNYDQPRIDTPFYAHGTSSSKSRKTSGRKRKPESIPIASDSSPRRSQVPVVTPKQQEGIRETFICQISGCKKPISVLRNGAWSIRRVLQEHGHLPSFPSTDADSDVMITCQWEDEEGGKKCLQKTKWTNYTRHFSGHLGVLIRQCEFCKSVQARPSNLARHFRTCRAYQEQDDETRREAWMRLNTRVDFEEFERSLVRR